jgi:hypothetical protein
MSWYHSGVMHAHHIPLCSQPLQIDTHISKLNYFTGLKVQIRFKISTHVLVQCLLCCCWVHTLPDVLA